MAKMQGCSGYFLKFSIETLRQTDKKPEHSQWPCSFMVRWTAGRPAKFEFLFWLGVRSLSYKTITVTLQKRAGNWQVWLLHWNGAIGWDEMKLVSGLCASDRAFGKAGGGEMELGQEIAKWKVRNHSCRGVNPAYECSERTERPVPVRHELV